MVQKSISNLYGEKDIFLLKLHDIFLRKFLLLFITIFITLGIIFYLWIKDIYIEQIKIDLLHNIDIVSLLIKELKNIDKITKDIKNITSLRVTIITTDGTVVGESDKDFKLMDNHINRVEIKDSRFKEYGSIIRYSHTLKKELLYVAKRFYIHKQPYYIRMARDIEQIDQEFFYLSLKIGALFLVFMAIAFNISLKISKDVQDETKAILDFLRKLTKQKSSISISSNYSQEFFKITKLLTAVSERIVKKEKQKAKYTAKLKLSNRQKDDIISAISHEFKNPIAVISGYTQTLLEDKNIDPTILEKFLTKISSNASKLTTMIDRLRLSIKLEENKQKLKLTDINIYSLIQNLIEDLKITYPNREISLNGTKSYIQADETLISIAITNLIENALKYSHDEVIVTISENIIEVKDSGIGISSEDIVKITNKFYRVSNNSWNNSLGVGLSLVKNILDLHKFKLEVKSKLNEGSNFCIVHKNYIFT